MATKPFFRRRKSDPFEGEGAPVIDYKDTRLLQRYISDAARSFPRASPPWARRTSASWPPRSSARGSLRFSPMP